MESLISILAVTAFGIGMIGCIWIAVMAFRGRASLGNRLSGFCAFVFDLRDDELPRTEGSVFDGTGRTAAEARVDHRSRSNGLAEVFRYDRASAN